MPRRNTVLRLSPEEELEMRALEDGWREIEPATARRLLVAGVMAFAAKGYHATTTRDIAERAGLSPGGLYVHFASKEELLYRISLAGTRESLEHVRKAAMAADNTPQARLRAVIESLAVRGARYHTTGRVIEYELGSLDEGHRAEVAALRREIAAIVREILEDGRRQGVFDVPDVEGTTVAVLSLAVDVARWYRTSGRRAPEEIGDLYADLAWRLVRKVP
ncbi:TetR family transcriptional regulator [Actinomadura barringtoniae]|uniref:TetR family transcriptional regulator n=1 Tax=Actinomadura barringtoniae TaxID=1427535 RepID=A0A939PQ03_9ACTN|nr:TetR/AcrR family transcriptional regulator [Actinomadura barringtoniae]MBO2454034.1 TetR family transcriptional regulator [Actinomadura barringtoniae]